MFLGLVGIGGLPARLFRSISTQNISEGIDAGIAVWLVGFTLWNLLRPWSRDHLRRSATPSEPAAESELASS